MNVYTILEEEGLKLPITHSGEAVLSQVRRVNDNILVCSGSGPDLGDGKSYSGKIGIDFTVEEGKIAARNCILKLLSRLQVYLEDLNKIRGFIRILVFVNCDSSFTEQAAVANGASELLLKLFGVNQLPSRSTIGVSSLPKGNACEIEAVVELY